MTTTTTVVQANPEHPAAGPLRKLAQPEQCSMVWTGPNDKSERCQNVAHYAVGDVAICRDEMVTMAGMNGDNAAYFAEAMREHQLLRVLIRRAMKTALDKVFGPKREDSEVAGE
jgi:hypothetical protein